MLSAWPLESESNVIHQDLFFNFINQLYSGEGILKSGDLSISVDTDGIGVKIAPGAAIIAYDSAFGGKRVFYNSTESKSGPNRHPNPSFDVNTNRWTVIGAAALTRDVTTFNSTPASGKIATSGASSFDQGIRTPITAAAGYRTPPSQLQEVSCWVNAPVGTTVRLKITEYNTAGTAGTTRQKDIAGAGVWQKVTTDPFTTAATTTFLGTEILIQAAGSVNVFVDDFQCAQNFDWIQGFDISDPTNPRVDRVVAQIRDSAIVGGGDTAQDAKFRVISGTPTAGATLSNLTGAAAVPSNCFLIANVLVPANATVLVGGNLDQTVMATASLNVVIPPAETMPLGIPYPYCGSAAPTGYLMCIGQTISRTTYAALFAVVGTSYNTGGEAGTDFRLPDLRGRMPVGVGTHVDINALGDNEGEATVGNRRPKHKTTLSLATQAAHGHGASASGSASSVGDHSHGGGASTWGSFQGGSSGTFADLAVQNNTGGAGGHSHGIDVDVSISDGGSHNHPGSTAGVTSTAPLDAPAYVAFNWIMRSGL